ncbi:acylphosphatase [bacterium]|nr:acylphosphatase [bacterium]
MKAAAEITVSGLVQGVGFRWFTQKRATELNLNGFVRNSEDGSVLVEVEGDRRQIEILIEKLHKGPAFSRVKDLNIIWKECESRFENFYIKD